MPPRPRHTARPGEVAAAPSAGWIPDSLWAAVQDSVPIVCVDVIPVRRDSSGAVARVGLIRRRVPFAAGVMWCHVGGRVNLGEELVAAARRHLADALGPAAARAMASDAQPDHVMQFFREPQPVGSGHGWDPRKHAVALTYVVEVPDHVAACPGGEALSFTWFGTDDLPAEVDAWPGVLGAVRAALRCDAARLT